MNPSSSMGEVVEVRYSNADGTTAADRFIALDVSSQLWDGGRALLSFVDGCDEAGWPVKSVHYTTCVRIVRRPSATGRYGKTTHAETPTCPPSAEQQP